MSDITGGGTLRAVTAAVSGNVDNTETTIELNDAFEASFYDALGRVVVAFGRLEYSTLIVIKRLRQFERQSLGQPPKTFDDAVLENFPVNFEECEKHAPSLFSKLITDSGRQSAFTALLSKARTLWETERNDCLHCCWTATTGRAPMRLRPKRVRDAAGNWTLTWEPSGEVPVNTLLDVAQRVEETALQIRSSTVAP